ncbi:Uncharacterised protein [uncultured Clostridium sp.]|nr:Uncharacterised protein [uncultured Clostridium sp.]SCJ43579.1 Uncharacterised protein [uncultured Clostridium sp.]
MKVKNKLTSKNDSAMILAIKIIILASMILF